MMTVKELKEILNNFDETAEVKIEMEIDGVEFDTGIKQAYESGNVYLFGDFGIPENYTLVDNSVQNVVVLPSKHGRLIDADAIEYDTESCESDSSITYQIVGKDDIDAMDTIVAATNK